MKTLWNIVTILLVAHLLLLVGGGLWLWQSGRLDKARVKQTIAMFSTTLTEEQAKAKEAESAAVETQRQKEEAARLTSVSQGSRSPEDRIMADDRDEELLHQRLQRLERERQDLLRQIDMAKSALAKERKELDGKRDEFEKKVTQEINKRKDEDFQLAVQMYEQVRPKQGKEMMQQLIAEGKTDQVVEYLAAMQLRKAASILKEFKTPAEVAQAAELVQQLRKRGVEPLTRPTDTGNGATTQPPATTGANQPADVSGAGNQGPDRRVQPARSGDVS